jgi:hypothetical protein
METGMGCFQVLQATPQAERLILVTCGFVTVQEMLKRLIALITLCVAFIYDPPSKPIKRNSEIGQAR